MNVYAKGMPNELLRLQKMHNGEKAVATFSAAEMTRRQDGLRSILAEELRSKGVILCSLAEAVRSHPDLVRRLAVVDVTPGTDEAKAEPIISFISGPEQFASFVEILERTVQFNPTRTESSLRRGVLHNAHEQPDGTWVWRYDRVWARPPEFGSLWDAVDAVQVPLLLVRGGLSGVVGDEDVEELRRSQPSALVVVVEGAGHSIQGDRPVQLARVLDEFLGAGAPRGGGRGRGR